MANQFYQEGLRNFARGEIDWFLGSAEVWVVDLGFYTPNFSTDEFVDDIPPSARPDGPFQLSSRSVDPGGILRADDRTVTLGAGAPYTNLAALVIAQHETTGGRLIAYIDTAPGLPIDSNFGGDLIIQWDPSGIAQLG